MFQNYPSVVPLVISNGTVMWSFIELKFLVTEGLRYMSGHNRVENSSLSFGLPKENELDSTVSSLYGRPYLRNRRMVRRKRD